MGAFATIRKAFGFGRSASGSITSAPPPPSAASPKPTDVVGTSGTAVFGGFVNSTEKNSKLVGSKRWTTFANLKLNTAIVATGIRYFATLISGTEWHFKPADDSGEAGEKVAEAMTKILLAPRAMATPWNRVMAKASMSRYDGNSVAEWTAVKRPDGLIGLADIESRPSHTIWRWDVDHTGTVIGVWQLSPWDYQQRYIPRAKLLYLVDDVLGDSPEGIGLLRHVVELADQLRQLERVEGNGYSTSLSGIPVAHAPYAYLEKQVALGAAGAGITAAQRDASLAPLHNFLQYHETNPELALALDSDVYRDVAGNPTAQKLFEIELLKGDTTAMAPIDKAIQRKIEDIARVFGVEGLLVGGGRGGGSLALSKNKTEVLSEAVSSVLNDLACRVDHDIVTTLMLLNGFDLALQPTIVPVQDQLRDIDGMTKALVAIAQSALADDDEAINAIRDLLGLPHAPERVATVGGAVPVLPQRGPKAKPTATPPTGDEVDVDTDDLDDADPGAQAVA